MDGMGGMGAGVGVGFGSGADFGGFGVGSGGEVGQGSPSGSGHGVSFGDQGPSFSPGPNGFVAALFAPSSTTGSAIFDIQDLAVITAMGTSGRTGDHQTGVG